ncbi:MAG: Hpt domain-containing protein [Gammaproteobacteria bacterium]
MDIFDENMALEKVDGNRELMLELLGMMIEQLPKNIAELEAAMHGADKDEQWNIAHRLTGATAYCGVPALQASTRALEHSIKNDQADIAERFAAVRHDAETILHYHREHFT